MEERKKNHYILYYVFLTWFFKFFIEYPPCLCDPLQTLLHGLDVHVRAVALWELGVTVAPAVIVFADKLPFSIAGYVAQSSLHKALPQVVWEDHLQACKIKLGLTLSSKCALRERQWGYRGNILLTGQITYLIKPINRCVCMPNSYICFLYVLKLWREKHTVNYEKIKNKEEKNINYTNLAAGLCFQGSEQAQS